MENEIQDKYTMYTGTDGKFYVTNGERGVAKAFNVGYKTEEEAIKKMGELNEAYRKTVADQQAKEEAKAAKKAKKEQEKPTKGLSPQNIAVMDKYDTYEDYIKDDFFRWGKAPAPRSRFEAYKKSKVGTEPVEQTTPQEEVVTETKTTKKSTPTPSPDYQYWTWQDVLKYNENDPEKVAEWLNTHSSYVPGKLTKQGMTDFGYEYVNGKWQKIKPNELDPYYDDVRPVSGGQPIKEYSEENTTDPKDVQKWWKNFIFGNGYGSVEDKEKGQRNKDAKEKMYQEFLKNNPSIVKAIFGKYSGLNIGERLERLGELIATAAANGGYGSLNKGAIVVPKVGRFGELYDSALKSSNERRQTLFNEENDAKKDKVRRTSIIESSPILKSLSSDSIDFLADRIITDVSQAEWEDLFKSNGISSSVQKTNIMNTFNSLRDTYESVTNQRKKATETETAEFDLAQKPNTAIRELMTTRNELIEKLAQVDKLEADDVISFIKNYRNIYAGISQTSSALSNTEGSDWNWNAQASVKGGIPIISGNASGGGGQGGNTSTSNTSSSTMDKLAQFGIDKGINVANEWKRNTSEYRKELKRSIKFAIQEIDAQIENLRAYAEKYNKIDDGIVKPKGMKQWLKREDGTVIELNPKDYIYATKNKIMSSKDCEGDVVPLEKEDKVAVIHKKLGSCDGKKIIKSFDYYLTKLK